MRYWIAILLVQAVGGLGFTSWSSAWAESLSIPREIRIPNRTGSQCVWCSLETAARYHKIEQLYGLTARYKGTAGPGNVEPVLQRANVRYRMAQTGCRATWWLKDSIDKGYPVAVGLNGSHMVTLVGWADGYYEIIDNSDRALEVRRWPAARFERSWDGWAIALIPDGAGK